MVALVSSAEGKASIVVGVSQDLTGRVNAVDLVRAASAAVGGKGGGGRPDMAQAGGPGRRAGRCGTGRGAWSDGGVAFREWASPRMDWPVSYLRAMIILTRMRKITTILGRRL